MTVIVSEQYRLVIGVDTHAATHTMSLIAVTSGAVLDEAVFPATTVGLSRAHGWITAVSRISRPWWSWRAPAPSASS